MKCLNCYEDMFLADKVRNIVRYWECACGVECAEYPEGEFETQWGLTQGKEIIPGRLAITRSINKGV